MISLLFGFYLDFIWITIFNLGFRFFSTDIFTMTLTVGHPQFIGQPCGHHGQYTFYKAFKYQKRGSGKVKILMLGQFFFVRISAHDDPCIGELQLLWEDRANNQVLSSTRLYFLPEQTPDGRQPLHGEVRKKDFFNFYFFLLIDYHSSKRFVIELTLMHLNILMLSA